MKVALIGTAPYHRHLAPYDDHEWEIWPCAPGNRRVLPRVTRWFELHGIDDCKGPENNDWNADYFAWLREQKFPVYMQEPNELVPECRIFPIRQWLREFGNFGRMAATSSISYMIGFAIMEQADTIAIFGVDMADPSEAYTYQKPGIWIMLELARQRGINIQVPLSSCLGQMPPLYGYAEASRMGRKLAVREMALKEELSQVSAQLEQTLRRKEWVAGHLEAFNYVRRTFVDGEMDAILDVEETLGEVEGKTTSIMHPKGTMVEFPSMRPVGEEIDPAKMDVVEVRPGVLVPREYAPAAE